MVNCSEKVGEAIYEDEREINNLPDENRNCRGQTPIVIQCRSQTAKYPALPHDFLALELYTRTLQQGISEETA